MDCKKTRRGRKWLTEGEITDIANAIVANLFENYETIAKAFNVSTGTVNVIARVVKCVIAKDAKELEYIWLHTSMSAEIYAWGVRKLGGSVMVVLKHPKRLAVSYPENLTSSTDNYF